MKSADRMAQHLIQRAVTGIAAALALTATLIQGRVVLQGNLWHLGTFLFYAMLFLLFLIRRPSVYSSRSISHWVFALSGVFLPFFLILAPTPDPILFWSSLPLQVCGMVISFVALSTLGRSFGVIAAHREIKRRGPYRLVRHPLYLGEALWFLSLVIQNLSWFNVALFCAQILCQVQRIREEESILSRDPVYLAYRDAVPYRLLPSVF